MLTWAIAGLAFLALHKKASAAPATAGAPAATSPGAPANAAASATGPNLVDVGAIRSPPVAVASGPLGKGVPAPPITTGGVALPAPVVGRLPRGSSQSTNTGIVGPRPRAPVLVYRRPVRLDS